MECRQQIIFVYRLALGCLRRPVMTEYCRPWLWRGECGAATLAAHCLAQLLGCACPEFTLFLFLPRSALCDAAARVSAAVSSPGWLRAPVRSSLGEAEAKTPRNPTGNERERRLRDKGQTSD